MCAFMQVVQYTTSADLRGHHFHVTDTIVCIFMTALHQMLVKCLI